MKDYIKHYIDSLNPINVQLYLRRSGWELMRKIGEKGSIWNRIIDGTKYQVLLPEDKKLLDYNQRIEDVIETLSNVENRPEITVVNDLLLTSSDLIRFRVASNETSSGTIPLTRATDLAKGIETLLLSAACATINPRAYFPKVNINQAKRYIEQCRMGQSERGSFILTVLSPVSQSWSSQMDLFNLSVNNEEFERKVIQTFFSSLTQLRNFLEDFNETRIEELIRYGVSANFCEALHQMKPSSTNGELEIGIRWSDVRPVDEEFRFDTISFSYDVFHMFKLAADILRKNVTIDDYDLRGYVYKTIRETPDDKGKIALHATIDESIASVNIELEPDDYQIALQSHMEYLPLYCKGELRKEVRGYTLLNPREVKMENESNNL